MIRRSNQGGQKGKRQGAPAGKGRQSSSPRTSDAKRHTAPRGSDGGRGSAPRKEGFGKTSDKAHSKPFGKSGDKPFSKGGDRPFKKSGDRDFDRSDRKPFGQSAGHPQRGGSDRPFKKSGERDYSPTDRKPFGKGSERPARRDDARGSDRPDRKAYDRAGERPARSESDRPYKKSGERGADRKPLARSAERPYRTDDAKPFKKTGDRDFGKSGRKPFAASEERPRKVVSDEDFSDDDFIPSEKYELPAEAKALAWDYEEDGKAVSYVDYTEDDGVNWDDDDDSEYAGRATVVNAGAKDKPAERYDAKPLSKATSRPYKPAELKSKEATPDKPKKKAAARKQNNDGLTRLNKIIAQAGVCSRREADTLIATGVIEVNGKIITELGYRVAPTDKVSMSGQSLVSQNKVYILLNKPKDYITTSNDPQNRRTVFELIKDATRERVFSVGRLDRSTTGVLLFTNDGEVAEKLTHPSFNKKKIYQVELHKSLSGNDFHQILEGLTLEDGFIAPDALSYIDHNDKSQIGIEIHSGRNRIVRRIFEHLGYNVVRLDRVYYAGLTKKNLPRGKWRFLNEKEVAILKQGAFE